MANTNNTASRTFKAGYPYTVFIIDRGECNMFLFRNMCDALEWYRFWKKIAGYETGMCVEYYENKHLERSYTSN